MKQLFLADAWQLDGFTLESIAVNNLAYTVSQFKEEERSLFLFFNVKSTKEKKREAGIFVLFSFKLQLLYRFSWLKNFMFF